MTITRLSFARFRLVHHCQIRIVCADKRPTMRYDIAEKWRKQCFFYFWALEGLVYPDTLGRKINAERMDRGAADEIRVPTGCLHDDWEINSLVVDSPFCRDLYMLSVTLASSETEIGCLVCGSILLPIADGSLFWLKSMVCSHCLKDRSGRFTLGILVLKL